MKYVKAFRLKQKWGGVVVVLQKPAFPGSHPEPMGRHTRQDHCYPFGTWPFLLCKSGGSKSLRQHTP